MAASKDITEHVLQYFCMKCNSLLKETATIGNVSISEDCPNCGYSLSNNLLQVKKQSQKVERPLEITFRTSHEMNARLTFGVEQIDRQINIKSGGRLCIIGSREHAGMLVARLCVRSIMSIRQGGFGSKNVLVIDAGNSYDVYRYIIFFARQYGLDLKATLRKVAVSRVFTTRQLASMIIRKSAGIIQRLGTKLVVIPDLLKMFVEETSPKHRQIRYLINQITKAIHKIDQDIVLAVSLSHKRGFETSEYERMILPSFSTHLTITGRNSNKEKLSIEVKSQDRAAQFDVLLRELRIISMAGG
jgi:hypothetical protein